MSVVITQSPGDQTQIITAPPVSYSPPPPPVGGSYQKIVANGSGTSIVLTADSIALFNASYGVFGATNLSLTISLVTTGVGGVDVGPVSTGGWFYFVIYNPTTQTVAGLASLSQTPALPVGYTYWRRIGWFYYSSGIVAFAQRANSFDYIVEQSVVSGTVLSSPTLFSLATFVPPTAAKIRGYIFTNNNNVSVFDDNANSVFGLNAAPANACAWQWEFVPHGGPVQFYVQCSSIGGAAGIRGWEDNL